MKNIILILVLGSLFTHCAESTFEETPEKIRETYPNSEDMGGQEDSSPTNKDTADKDTSDENTEDAVSNPLDSSGSCQDLCTENATRCTGSVLEKCVQITTCTEWKVENCPENQACMDGACVEVEVCVDNDQDGYGPHCQKGPDCNDNDNAIHPGATEKCDNLDNDCDTNIDEDFTLGAVCSIGQGRCEKSGFIQCAANGTETSCSAQATAPDLEICDGIDNDCDGMIDEGDACNFCNGDGNEPNNTPTSATPLPADQPYWSAVCPGDTDYFSVTTTPNQSYRFSIQFPEAFSDLKLKGFGNGMLQGTADHGGDALNYTGKQVQERTILLKSVIKRQKKISTMSLFKTKPNFLVMPKMRLPPIKVLILRRS